MTFHYTRFWFIFYWNSLFPHFYYFFSHFNLFHSTKFKQVVLFNFYSSWMNDRRCHHIPHFFVFFHLNIFHWIATILNWTERTWNWTENESFYAPSHTCLTVFSNWIIFRSFIVKNYNSTFEWCLPTFETWLFSQFLCDFILFSVTGLKSKWLIQCLL